jgi:hypothetical protein
MLHRKIFGLLAISSVLFTTAAFSQVMTVPPGLNPGDSYRLVFITKDKIFTATSSSIATYDASVTSQANMSAELAALGTNWRVIGSTSLVDAKDHTDTDDSPAGPNGLPIYRLDGKIIANNYDDLWDGSIQNPLYVAQDGTIRNTCCGTWTGSYADGTAVAGAELGTSNVVDGAPYATASNWIRTNPYPATSDQYLYAISDVMTVPGSGVVDYVATYTFPGGSIYGHLPIPQTDGFDYFFTPVMVDSAVLGEGVTVESIDVSANGTNNGAVVNFDWEVHIGPTSFGLPEGQFTQTLVDPIAGYTRTAPTQFRFVIGNQVDNQSYPFSAQHDFVSGTTTANPYFSLVQQAITSPMNLTDGLYAQVFLWTADNRNSKIDFGQIVLTVRGKMPAIQVEIDIKPGETANDINLESKGKIPVAVLTTESFDATQVDWETVSFGPGGSTESHERAHIEDVDLDGDMDMVLHFNTQETGIQCGDTEATLTGETFDGQSVTGTDAINTAKCPPVTVKTITELVGDKDCFGFGAPCSDGVSVVDPRFGPDGDALVEPSDPLGTDQKGTSVPLGGPSFDFQFDIASFDLIGITPTSASVTVFTGGIDLGGGPQFLFNGTSIGSYVEAAGQENIAATVVFDVPTYLLTNLNNLTLSFVDQGFIQDGFVIDYVELTVVGSDAASAP